MAILSSKESLVLDFLSHIIKKVYIGSRKMSQIDIWEIDAKNTHNLELLKNVNSTEWFFAVQF